MTFNVQWEDSELYIAECLFQGPFTLDLRRLYTGHGYPSTESTELHALYAQRLIRGAGASLKELTIVLLPHRDQLEKHEGYVDLSHNPGLVSLSFFEIRLSHELDEEGWDVLLRALASVCSPHLEDISIGLRLEYESHEEDLDVLDWEGIDELLALLVHDRPKLTIDITFDLFDSESTPEVTFTAEERSEMAESIKIRLPHMETEYPERLRFPDPWWNELLIVPQVIGPRRLASE